jgi:hypothetical protein
MPDDEPIENPPTPPRGPDRPFTAPQGSTEAEKVQDQVSRQAGLGPVDGGGGTIFTEPVLVVN